MAQPSSFYDYEYSWQGIRYDDLLCSLLNSCHRIMSHPDSHTLSELISHVVQQQSLDGYYRLEVCDQVIIEHYQNGRHVSYQGERPQKGSNSHSVKVVELEHAMIFKMRFIQLYLTKSFSNCELIEDSRDLWLLWLMHIESLCLQYSLNQYFKQELNNQQHEAAMCINYHVDLKVNMTRLERQMKDMHQEYGEQVMTLLNPSGFIEETKRQQLIERAISSHQAKLSKLIKQQYGLYLSSQRLLESILTSS